MSRPTLVIAMSCVLLAVVGSACRNATSGPMTASVSDTMPFEARPGFPATTADLVYTVPRQGGGPMTPYDLPLGGFLASYANDYLGAAFEGGPPLDIEIEIEHFRIRNYQAFLVAKFTVAREGNQVFQKSYTVTGSRFVQQDDSDSGFDNRPVIDRTTDEAMRALFARFLRDARAEHRGW